jgi:hypothetical protein
MSADTSSFGLNTLHFLLEFLSAFGTACSNGSIISSALDNMNMDICGRRRQTGSAAACTPPPTGRFSRCSHALLADTDTFLEE